VYGWYFHGLEDDPIAGNVLRLGAVRDW
jgi:hypothetical protein